MPGNSSKGAFLSDEQPDPLYRYVLWRIWDRDTKPCMFIMLNPSTADHEQDDPTVRRCVGFAKDWGYGGVFILNLFAFRATSPSDLHQAVDPIGPLNDEYLQTYAQLIERVVCAWGNHGKLEGRSRKVVDMLRERGAKLSFLTMTGKGEPGHPLYLKKTLAPRCWA